MRIPPKTLEIALKLAKGERVNKLDPDYLETIKAWAGDSNSSTLREGVCAAMMGLEQSPDKLGLDTVTGNVEIKPVNVYLKADGKPSRKLIGEGNFSDFTLRKHEWLLSEGVVMAIGGFFEGVKMVYLITFPYELLKEQMLAELDKGFAKGLKSIRSAQFRYNHYLHQAERIKVEWVAPNLEQYKFLFQPKKDDFYRFLLGSLQALPRAPPDHHWPKRSGYCSKKQWKNRKKRVDFAGDCDTLRP